MTIHDAKFDGSAQRLGGKHRQEVSQSVPATRSSKLRSIVAVAVVAVGLVATLAWTGFIGWLAFRLVAG